MSDEDLIVTIKDVRAAKLCAGGSRKFCRRHGIDWNDFVTNGIPASRLLEIDSAIMVDLVEVARGRRK